MKYTNQGVCHAWAHQTDQNASNGQGTIYSIGDTIFSYGDHFPIARHCKGVILFTTDTYSNTTSKHLGCTRYAIPKNATVFVCESTYAYLDEDLAKEKLHLSSNLAAKAAKDAPAPAVAAA